MSWNRGWAQSTLKLLYNLSLILWDREGWYSFLQIPIEPQKLLSSIPLPYFSDSILDHSIYHHKILFLMTALKYLYLHSMLTFMRYLRGQSVHELRYGLLSWKLEGDGTRWRAPAFRYYCFSSGGGDYCFSSFSVRWVKFF